ncbi:hypothetical protein M6D93_13835 [Jatrophihabitans telluris]|uniref:Rhamnogalacturonan lyase domain-containing protein n=1 Tax=Jatrophihabitans telluris TaxID=2038343 RepID=A0ABY4QWM4_9ACTN|nr:IPT/TIG domain-containing protein [Jatrophihabitans telluris]UQX87375.1 hypothetical protein M6D93_13835 [Jatrophihabitans telluris]
MKSHPTSLMRFAKAALAATLVVAAVQSMQLSKAVKAQAADAPGSITLSVASAKTVGGVSTVGDPITSYKWIVNLDDTGNPGTISNQGTGQCLPSTAQGGSTDPNYADTCQWPSVRVTSGFAPIVAQGTQDDLNATKALADLPVGKYLISVTSDGYKIDGQHFTVTSGSSQLVKVAMNATPLPLTTLRLQVFNDNAPVDATYEVDAERGLRGFTATLTDVFGLVSTDYYGNALCTKYLHDAAGHMTFTGTKPDIDPTSTGKCVSDSTGQIVIPNLGPNRFAATVAPPVSQTGQWVQTTTLEGGHDHDIWSQEGATGYDTEQTKGAELVPSVQFGFVRKLPSVIARGAAAATGSITGTAIAGLPYIGGQNGQVSPETGLAGVKSGGPIPNAWVALSDLGAGDAQVYTAQTDGAGKFTIPHVPNGSYQLSIWDDDQDYILWSFNVDVANGLPTDVGNKIIVGWFSHVYGKVFIDSNGNGKMDPGEKAVPQFGLTVRERDNTLMDQATNTVSTNDSGYYDIREAYPLGKWLILEGFNTRYQTTGITYKAENETKSTTQLGSLVDINFLPIIGLGGEIDWGVQPYAAGTNGGIVGTVSYDTTRNELDPADAVSESYQPGIPNVKVHLYVPVACDATTPADHCRQGYQLNDDGSMKRGPQVADTYTSEQWAPPKGCTARQYNGQPLTDQQALPAFGTTANALCVEAPMMGMQVGASDSAGGSQTVNGNYGFGTSDINLYPPGNPKNPAPNHDLALYANMADNGYHPQDLAPLDYLVGVDIPNDPVDGKPMYKVTTEADVNVFSGDSYVPQENYPPASQAVANQQDQGAQLNLPTPPSQPPSQQAGIISPCAGSLHTVTVTNPDFLAAGGSPFEGQQRPYCTDKLVTVRTGQSTAPNFNLYTDVPIPTHFWGLTLNDLGLSLDKRSVNFGEAQGLPYVPVGLYDWSGRLTYTTHTDFNGLYEALVPSTDTYNCPVPAGPCPNMYRFVGNDPGASNAPNADYNPRFRTIATNFQAWPGQYTVTDEAPTQVATTALAPDTTTVNPTQCDLGPNTPQLLAVDRPFVRRSDANRTLTIKGFGFGAARGTLTLGGVTLGTTAASWTDTQIVATLPTGTALPTGALPLSITRSDGRGGFNTLTIQSLGNYSQNSAGDNASNPRVVEVGPGAKSAQTFARYSTIQAALEAARPTRQAPFWVVVVYPGTSTNLNPQGQYDENVIVHHRVHIQGVGPGGFQPDGTFVPGSIIDGSGFNPDNPSGLNWIALLSSLRYSGNPAVPDAAAVTVLDDPAVTNGILDPNYRLTFDGFTVTGGAQSDFPANINELTGGIKTPYGAAGALVTQGGGIYLHSNVRNMQITDNIIRGNGGSYGGAVRVGTPYVSGNNNTDLRLANNQIRDNGGTNLAGGVGLFAGSDGYVVDHNALCGNFSAEYGGAISAFGYQEAASGTQSKGGTITNNRMWFNASYDEGGAVMIAGELPADPTGLSQGTGRVLIDSNVIQANLANDDGGGIRLLQVTGSAVGNRNQAENQTITISNDTVANNVSAHEGGGIALDDAPFVRIVNTTVTKNLTTATAVTSDGSPAPAGLSTATNSDPLQAQLTKLNNTGVNTTTFSKPTLLNDVFWDNRAGNFDGGVVCGIDSVTCPGIVNWDMGVTDDQSASLAPTHSVVQDLTQVTNDGTLSQNDPSFVSNYNVDVNILASRTYPAFRQAVIVAQLLPPSLMGDYHLSSTLSSAYGLGAANTTVTWGAGAGRWTYVVSAPSADIDRQPRPGTGRRWDAGSDQLLP